jgi:glycosyltransferase involved in cell wall biosynthesis
MLGALLQSLADGDVPLAAEIFIVIIDNDIARSAEPVWQGRADASPMVLYEVEERRGIPTSRNRALAVALRNRADLIAFVDDDETVDPSWLANLVQTLRGRGLHLVGGPVRVAPGTAGRSRWQSAILRGIAARYARKERAAAHKAGMGTDDDIVIVTNNWVIDAGWLRTAGLRFDERMLLTGGTDTRFFHQAKALGMRSGWAPAALVYETIPGGRLSFRYQMMRSCSQTALSFRRKHPGPGIFRGLHALLIAAIKVAGGCLYFLALPVGGGSAIVQSARLIGGGCGLVRALRNRESTLYQETDGY